MQPGGGGGGGALSLASTSQDPTWQRLWLRCQQHDWMSLALVGSSKAYPNVVIELGWGLARLAHELGQEIQVIDARNFGLREIKQVEDEIKRISARGKRCILVLRLVSENATSVPLGQLVDAALLGVFIGETSMVAASRSIDEIGRQKFLGTVILTPK
jgi:hypothetical protein